MHEIGVRLNGRGFIRDAETLEVDLESETVRTAAGSQWEWKKYTLLISSL